MNNYKFYIFLFLFSLVMLPSILAEPPNMQAPTGRNIQTTVYSNVSINLSANHNDLAGLQGGNSGQYYHLNNSIYNYLLSNIYSWISDLSNYFTKAETYSNFYNNSGNINAIGYNVSTDYFIGNGNLLTGVVGGNASWNQSYADTLYSNIQWDYNQTIPANSYTDLQVNKSFNQSLTDFLYAPISVIGDNASWNQSYANTLYYSITNPENYLNQTTLVESDPIFTSANSSLARIGNCSAGEVVQNTTLDGVQCIAQTNGNESWNQSYANTLYSNIQWNYNQSLPFYNWLSGFQYDYNQTIPANAYTDLKVNSTFNQTLTDSLYAEKQWGYNMTIPFTNWLSGFLYNYNQSLPFYNWLSGFQYDYNQTIPANAYTDLKVNSTFNQTLTDSLYAPIGITGDNASWNQSLANTLYANIQWNYNQTGIFNYNHTTIANAYTDSQGFITSTSANATYLKLTGGNLIGNINISSAKLYTNITYIGSACLYWNGTAMIGENPCTQ